MPLREIEPEPSKRCLEPQWVLMVLVLGVMILASVAFIHPERQVNATTSPISTASPTPVVDETELSPDALVTATESLPPTPEEIGYTDGIIFCSSILVLILLVGTLRETLRRKDHHGDKDE
jgi:TRAP-type C4-dicarboxylate transport system permease small subunit